MTGPRKSIFSKDDPVLKPQNQFSLELRKKIENELSAWMVKHDYTPYHARLFASYLCREAISERVSQTSPRAANVLLADKDKISDVLLEAKKLAQKLEIENKIDETLESLERLDTKEEGNSL